MAYSLTKEGNIIRAEDVELMIKQTESEITESQALKAPRELDSKSTG